MIHISKYSNCTVSFGLSLCAITVRWKQSDVLKSEYKKIKVRSNNLNIRMMVCLRLFLTKLFTGLLGQWPRMTSKTLILGHEFYSITRLYILSRPKIPLNYYLLNVLSKICIFLVFLILLFDFLAWYFTRRLRAILSTDFVSHI